MKFRMASFVPVIFCLSIQDFLHSGKAALNSGDFILNSDDVLEINTTTPSIVKRGCHGCAFTASLQNRSSSYGDHLVASITFSDDIEFKRGSTVKVFGKYALSITSQNGNISIQTDLNMTCDKEVFDTTCLGGFTQSSTSDLVGQPDAQVALYRGLGPGIPELMRKDFPLHTQCIPGSSHGGKAFSAPLAFGLMAGPVYDKENLTSLQGGSGGSCVLRPSGSVSGGGAIELVADNGCISIDASIRASAQSSSSEPCSGGSGGLIRLRAQSVEILSNGKLTVDGGDSGQTQIYRDQTYLLGKGAGGIIQIIAPGGVLYAEILFLNHGTNKDSKCGNEDDAKSYGYFYLAGDSRSGNYKTFPNRTFSWGENCCIVAPPTNASGLTTEDSPERLVHQLNLTRISVKTESEFNKSTIRRLLSMHKSLTDNEPLTTNQADALCLETFQQYNAIMDDLAQLDPEFALETLRVILKVASNCIEENNHAFWKDNGKILEFTQTLEETFIATLRGNISSEVNYTLISTNAVAQIVRKRTTKETRAIKVPDFSENEGGTSWRNVEDYLLIPRETVMKAKGNYTYVFLLYNDVANALPSNTAANKKETDWKVSSLMMSCFLMLDGVAVKELSPPALLTFNTSAAENREKQCFFWDKNTREWSSEGVRKIESHSGSQFTVCETNHFTSFAVLIKHKDIQLSASDQLALSIITYVGCGVSTAALIITLIVFLSVESLSAERHKIHMNLVVSLLFAQVLFLAGIKETSNLVMCKIIAMFLHYLFLTAFTWMLVEGLHLYLKVVQVFKTENVKILYYYVFGWGFAIIPVGITAAVKPNNYGNKDICWLSMEDGAVWAFIGPVIGIIVVNCFILFMVIKTVVTSAASVKSSKHEHIKAGIKGLFVLMPILGVGWILGLFALNKGTIVFEYAFACVNGFQGLLIFLLHCVFNNEVRQAFRRQREKNALSKENDSQYHASFSLSYSVDSKRKKNSFSHSSQDKPKAGVSFKKKKTTKLVQVQPLRDNPDNGESSLQVNRTFQTGRSNRLAATDMGNEISSLHCPISEDEERVPPKITHLVSQQTSVSRKHSRP